MTPQVNLDHIFYKNLIDPLDSESLLKFLLWQLTFRSFMKSLQHACLWHKKSFRPIKVVVFWIDPKLYTLATDYAVCLLWLKVTHSMSLEVSRSLLWFARVFCFWFRRSEILLARGREARRRTTDNPKYNIYIYI